jgi:hypothetical protein
VKRFILVLALLAAAWPQAARAQSAARLTLRSLQTEAFPLITGYFDARDESGARIPDLQAEQLQALEDGQPQPIQQLRSVQLGVRIILVVSPAESFAIRDAGGTSRFDHVRDAIREWGGSLPANSDTLLTLITPEGTLVSDAIASEWLAALNAYQLPRGSGTIDGAQSLQQALALAAQPPAEAGGATAIWWITSTPTLSSMQNSAAWTADLQESGTPLFVWQIDSPSTFENEASQALQALADESGGQRFTFSGPEALPSAESYFNPLRNAYFFQYTSHLRSAGEHELILQLQGESILASSPVTFSLNIQAPNPILVSPPAIIERGPSPDDPQKLAPFSQPIEIVVEFPDGFERNLFRSSLYVNDELVAENTTAPFNHFAWDLTPYSESQQVFLRVEVEDELGLTGESIDFPVEFNVQAPVGWFQALLARGGSALALSVVLIAAGAFFLVMVLSGRLAPSRINLNRIFQRDRAAAAPRPVADPLRDAPPGLESDLAASSPFLAAPPPEEAPAVLQRLTMQDPTQPAQVQAVLDGDLLIGSGPLCALILSEPSVDKQHARLTRDEYGEFRLADLNSQAGTWVNYAPVSTEGSRLQDGDIVHIGRVPFRFLINARKAN